MAEEPDAPEAVAARASRWSVPLVWLVPLVALAIGGWLAVNTYLETGPTITIRFKSAEGLEAGNTKVRYKDVEIGLVRQIELAEGGGVVVTVDLQKGTEKYLVEDTRFWVVRPRIAGGSVTGLGTLLSGAYIGADPGKATRGRRDFAGLERAPAIASDVPGRAFVLRAEDAGSLEIGSPVYLRRVKVGKVSDSTLDADGTGVTLTIFIDAPYDVFVKRNSRFWHASGIDLSLDSSGLRVSTESLVALAIGGVAFATPPGEPDEPAPAGASFRLFDERVMAMRQPEGIVDTYVMVFHDSVRGLQIGAPVDFRGIVVGEVAALHTQTDARTGELRIPVEVRIFPERFTSRLSSGRSIAGLSSAERKQAFKTLAARGLRGQLRTANLLTGQLYVALDIFPDAPKVNLDLSQSPLEFPTVPSNLADLQEMLARIAKRLDQVPFDTLAAELGQALKSLDRVVGKIDSELAPQAGETLAEARKTLAEARRALVELRTTLGEANRTLAAAARTAAPDAPLQQDIRDAAREIARAAQALRTLADYLERHPEALLRGKAEDAK